MAHLEPKADDPNADDGLPKTAKEVETKYLIELMKHNYEAVNVTEKYRTLKDVVDGVPKEAFDVTGGVEDPDGDGGIAQPGASYELERIKERQKDILEDPKRKGINVGDGDLDEGQDLDAEQQRDQKMKELLAFPAQREAPTDSKPVVDSQEIRDRILTLKLMFDDSNKLRQQRDFLNTHGQNVMTNPDVADQGLGLVREFNQKNLEINPA